MTNIAVFSCSTLEVPLTGLQTELVVKMATPSSPASASASASDGCSPRSSPTRSNTAPPRAPSYLPGQAGNTSPTRNTRFQPHIPFTSYKQSQTGSMPSLSNFEVNGFSGTGSQNPQSTFQSQASVLAQQDNENETAGSGMNPEKRPAASWGRPLILQEDRQGENTDPMEDLPSKSWEELETRYERDMEAAIQHEQSIVDEIEWVMKVRDC